MNDEHYRAQVIELISEVHFSLHGNKVVATLQIIDVLGVPGHGSDFSVFDDADDGLLNLVQCHVFAFILVVLVKLFPELLLELEDFCRF